MTPPVDLYNSAYRNYDDPVYREIRREAYGVDLGQTSWVDSAESEEIPKLLAISSEARVLEIGCGSGRYALWVAERTGCEITGVDLNAHGVDRANALLREQNVSVRARFEQCDVSDGLPFADDTFDAVFANDVLCHLRGRQKVLSEIFRVLRAQGRLLFSDALVMAGLVSHEEIALRSSIGYYLFSPPGLNEQLIEAAGFELCEVRDTTARAADIAKRRREAREARRERLLAVEDMSNFEGLQRFLSCVTTLMQERRLLRFVYVAHKGA